VLKRLISLLWPGHNFEWNSTFCTILMGPGKSTALLSAFRYILSTLSAPMCLLAFLSQCYVSVLPAGGKRKVR
jgi:hypothetical protein